MKHTNNGNQINRVSVSWTLQDNYANGFWEREGVIGERKHWDELQPDGDAVQVRDPVSQGADPVADGKADANFVSGTGAAVKDAVLDYQGQIQGGTDLSEGLFDSPVGGHSSGFASEEGHGRADVHYEALVPNIGPLAKTGEHVLCDHAQGKGLGLAKLYQAGRPPLQR